MQTGRSPALSKMHRFGAMQGNIPSAHCAGTPAVPDSLHRPLHLPISHASPSRAASLPCHDGKQQEETPSWSASATAVREAGPVSVSVTMVRDAGPASASVTVIRVAGPTSASNTMGREDGLHCCIHHSNGCWSHFCIHLCKEKWWSHFYIHHHSGGWSNFTTMKDTGPTSASTTAVRLAHGDDNEMQAAGRAQPGLSSICSLQGSCSISHIQGNSHQAQVICCNIVARSCSWFEGIGDVLGVLGLPQSTAGRRYEISIYILQPSQESDNLTVKLRGEWNSLERLVGGCRVPWASRMQWPGMDCNRVPGSTQVFYPDELLPTHPFCSLTIWWFSQPSWSQKKRGGKEEESKSKVNSSTRANSTIWGLFFSQHFNED